MVENTWVLKSNSLQWKDRESIPPYMASPSHSQRTLCKIKPKKCRKYSERFVETDFPI